MRKLLSTTALVCAATALAGTAPAIAQTGAQTGAPAASVPRGIEEIVVTAQRREQSAQDVGIALTAIGGDELKARGITTVNQLETVAPSLEIEGAFGSGQPVFRLRGVGFNDYASNNAPTVGIYVDEVAYPIPAMTQGILFDLERVEILRGPQGTLYGRNTTGGAVNLITAKPTAEPAAGLTAEYGRFDQWSLEGFVSGPLGDRARARLAATTVQGGGWAENRVTGETLGDQDRGAVRAQVELDATEAFTIRLTGHYTRDQSDGNPLYNVATFTTPGGVTVAGDRDRWATGWGTSPSFAAQLGLAPDAKPFKDNEQYGAHAHASLDLSGVTLTSITSYESLDRREYNDWDATRLAIADVFFGSEATVFAQEFRVSSSGSGPLTWTAGAYYSAEDLDEEYRSGFIDSLGVNAFTPYEQEVRTRSVFGQAEYRVTPQLNLILGLRYEDEERELKNLSTTGFLANGFPIPFVVNANRSLDMSEVTGKGGVEFTVNDDVLLYATVSRGVKSGGFTAYNTLSPPQADPFQPEELWAYEAGVKADLVERTLRLNAAAYYYDYTNQQVQTTIVDRQFGLIGRFANVPESEITGVEAEIEWSPVPELLITQSLGYKTGEYVTFSEVDPATLTGTAGSFTASTVNRAGQDLGFPDFSYQGSVTYTLATGGFTIEPSFDYSYKDNFDSPLGATYDVDGYWLVNARIAFSQPDANWQATLWARNIFDEKYDVTRNFFAGPQYSIAQAGAPATYGLRVSVGF